MLNEATSRSMMIIFLGTLLSVTVMVVFPYFLEAMTPLPLMVARSPFM